MNLLAIGAHPDDIEFGCAGTLMKYADNGHGVYMLVVTEGGMGGEPGIRREEADSAAGLMGVKKILWGSYRDTEIALSKSLIDDIERVIHEVDPAFIFVHHQEDTHQDHRALAQAAISATRYVRNVLFYEGPTSVDFSPNVFVDIGSHLERKLDVLAAYDSQTEKTNIPDLNILDIARAVAVSRGIQARTKYAEGFVSLRLFINVTEEGGQSP
jgi:LmbE family N-acetylglucosaminyl deacetylase